MKKIFLVIVLFLSACGTPPTNTEISSANYGNYPSNYKNIIKNYYSRNLKDPSSVVYRNWSGPEKFWYTATRWSEPKYGYLVCVSRNAKNSYGGYTGFKDAGFLIRDGKIQNIFLDGYLSGKRVC